MRWFNGFFTAIFDVVLAPFGHTFAGFDLVVWPTLAGIVALLVYKSVSNQAGIARAKNGIQVHLLEVVLWRDDLAIVVSATAKTLLQNALYVGYNILPMIVMFVPMTGILVQLVAHYAYAPLPVGEPTLLVAELADGTDLKSVSLTLPDGVVLDAPPVRSSDGEVAWRIVPKVAGDHVLAIAAGGAQETITLSAGGDPRKVTVLRTSSWEAVLYPAENVPTGPFEELRLDRRDQPLAFFPDGEGGILLWFFGFSLAAGFLLKDRFGVTL